MKKELCQFLDIPNIYHRAKTQIKLLRDFSEKRHTDGQTDRQTIFRTLRRIEQKYGLYMQNKCLIYRILSFQEKRIDTDEDKTTEAKQF